MLRILFLGDVVGEPGRKAVLSRLPALKREREIDCAIVNGENAAGGRGMSPKITIDFLRAGAAVVTTGDHVWDQPDIIPFIGTEPRLLRPLNYPEGAPGAGSVVLETAKGAVGVINAQGRTFMKQDLENPFLAVRAELERIHQHTRVVVLDFHAEATSEKQAMGRFLDGKVSMVVGTHTHVQTADESIFPGGTAFLCDAGMCGVAESVIGSEMAGVLEKFTTAMPSRFYLAKGDVELRGVIVDVDEATGRAIAIERLVERIRLDEDGTAAR
jgi:metallophosphoesterase (TIGR00282 family)